MRFIFRSLRFIVLVVLGSIVGILLASLGFGYISISDVSGVVGGGGPEEVTLDDAIIEELVIEPRDLSVTVSATGSIEPNREVNLQFELTGIVQSIEVEEGQAVREGTQLANLEATELEAALREAEIALELQRLALVDLTEDPREVDLAAAQAAVNAAQAQLVAAYDTGPSDESIEIARLQTEIALNQLWQTQLDRDAYFELNPEFRGGRTSEIPVEQGVTQADFGVEVASAQLDAIAGRGADQGSIASANSGLVQAQVALERLLDGADEADLLLARISLERADLALEQARIALDATILEAPFDGVISQNNLREGELPPTNLPAMQILDTSGFFVDLAIDENDIVEIAVDQPVTLRLDALPEAEIAGRITRLALTSEQVGETVVFRARVALDPTLEPIRVGMTTTATITTRQLDDVIAVPNPFIRVERETQQAFVTILDEDGELVEVPVELGVRNTDISEIVSGLEPGQRVVRVQRDTLGLAGVIGGPG